MLKIGLALNDSFPRWGGKGGTLVIRNCYMRTYRVTVFNTLVGGQQSIRSFPAPSAAQATEMLASKNQQVISIRPTLATPTPANMTPQPLASKHVHHWACDKTEQLIRQALHRRD